LVFPVIPAKAGIQEKLEVQDPGDPVPAKAGSRVTALMTLYAIFNI
jgi:hypothetical protein